MNQNETKIGWFEYLYFFMIVIYAAMAIGFTSSMMGYYKEPIGFLLPIAMTSILLIRNKVTFKNIHLFYIIFIYTIWNILQYLIFKRIDATYSLFGYYNIIIAYIIISVFKTKIFFLYEKIVTQLSIVAIIGWVLMIIIPNILGHLIDIIKFPNSENEILRGNIIIFSMTNSGIYNDIESFGLTRNSGFSWEPGRYASMLVIALYFNLARTRFQFKMNNGLWILLIALATTQSTTGFMSFSILIAFILINQNKSKLFYLAFIIPLAIMTYSLPFMGDKLNSLMDVESNSLDTEGNIKYQEEIEGAYVPQRFDGLNFELMNIIHDPILGYGNDPKDSYANKNISDTLSLSNGILKVFARFGLIIGGLFYFLLYKSSKWFANFYKIKGIGIYMLLYLSISISYDFIQIPFFLSLVLFELFARKNTNQFRNETELSHII
jgi:hypothetical protein